MPRSNAIRVNGASLTSKNSSRIATRPPKARQPDQPGETMQMHTATVKEVVCDLDQYQTQAALTDRNPKQGTAGIHFALLGLFGEVGSVLSELKKKQRDQDSY